ncbi:MAG: TIGR02757 family protein [Crocinitomicaceae bacterium]|nr:TIGR02757 family protein [Crocinitomicaceae bacterium]
MNKKELNELKELLDLKLSFYNNSSFISEDPIAIPHQFNKKQDIEIMGLLMATIAWGNRKSIIKSGEKLLDIMEGQPYHFIQNYDGNVKPDFHFVHRTFQTEDLHFFITALHRLYKEFDSMEKVFQANNILPGALGRIISFRNYMLQTSHALRSKKHLSNPLKNSAAKRLNMFLRWMVRSDEQGVDFGIWKDIASSELYLPLDVHTGNVARKLNILKRKQNDLKALEEIMIVLRKLDDKDPVKYDYALFSLGVHKDLD